MALKQWLFSGLLASTCLVSIAAAGPIENYSPVTAERLKNPEPGNWMHYRRTYDGQGYSPLDQINTSNVKNLTPVWTFSTGVIEGHEAPPIINNGVMFVATPMGQVIALNAKTGDEYWRYKRQLPEDLFQLHPTSRGVGLWQDKLYLATTDDHLVALDAKTGKVVWDTKVQDYKKGQYLTLMPLIVDGKVIVGDSWDWDEVDAPMLVDLQRDGRTIKSLIHPGRNAIFWVLERKPDSIKYVAGWPFVHTDVWKGIEPESGKPIVDPAHKPVIGKRVEFCPSLWGGKDWPSAAYSQKTGLVCVPANENFCGGFTGEKVPLVAGQLWLGTKPEDIGLTVRPGATHFGELQAWDPATGKKAWSHNFP